MKDLPKVFANPIEKNISNNKNFSYGKLDEQEKIRDEQKVLSKINKYFSGDRNNGSREFLVKFANKEDVFVLIGCTNNNLITKAGRLIPIRDVYDISLI